MRDAAFTALPGQIASFVVDGGKARFEVHLEDGELVIQGSHALRYKPQATRNARIAPDVMRLQVVPPELKEVK